MDTTLLYKKFPIINFIGNKENLTRWIYKNTPDHVSSILDLFCGGCSVSYFFKANGKRVISNDAMVSSFILAKAMIENKKEKISESEIDLLLSQNGYHKKYFEDGYSNVKFFKEECIFLDNIRENIEYLKNDYKKALAFASMRRAMIRKMPYSRFNIPWNLIKKLRDEELSYKRWGRKRAYHNLPFQSHFIESVKMYNEGVFNNQKDNVAMNMDALSALKEVKNVDAVYFDPPYAGKMNDYYGFYGFIDEFITLKKAEKPINDFTNKTIVIKLFEKMFDSASHIPVWMVSYNSRSFPDKKTILSILNKYGKVETVEMQHQYKLTNSLNKKSDKEYLFIVKI
jgi:adenine-specific DNA-methyltransferase